MNRLRLNENNPGVLWKRRNASAAESTDSRGDGGICLSRESESQPVTTVFGPRQKERRADYRPRTRASRSERGRAAKAAIQPTKSGRRPKTASTVPSCPVPGRKPPSTFHPPALSGNNAADGARRAAAPLLRRRRASLLTFFVCVESAGQNALSCLRRSCIQVIGYFNGPQRTADVHEFGLVGDALMAQKLRPGPVRRVREVLNRSFGRTVPSRRRLAGALPKERETRVGMTVNGHVAGEATRARARS
jgi:hypothetical protein